MEHAAATSYKWAMEVRNMRRQRKVVGPARRFTALAWGGALALSATLLGYTRPTLAQGSFVTINGAQLFVTDEGSGTPVVLLHGGFMDSTMWDAQAAALAGKHRVIRFDFRGFGRSARPTQPIFPSTILQRCWIISRWSGRPSSGFPWEGK